MKDDFKILGYVECFSEHSHVSSRLIIGGQQGVSPFFTIAIPTYKRLDLLKEAIQSALSQDTGIPFEVIVVDNNPDPDDATATDALVAAFSSPKLSLYRNEENIGMFGNWNRCLQLAKGEWVTILSDDDLLNTNFISANISAIQAEPDIRLVGCVSTISDERGIKQNIPPARRLLRKIKSSLIYPRFSTECIRLYTENYFVTYPFAGISGVAMHRQSSLKLGGFAASNFPSADAVFITRFHLEHGSYFLPEKNAVYRISANESMNGKVLDGWIKQGIQVRKELLPLLGAPYFLLKMYTKMAALEAIKSYRLFFNNEIDVSSTITRLQLKGYSSYLCSNILGLFILYCYRVKRIVTRNKR
jgi:glycosyltransferase involved in cell wall biosynthesis